MSLLAPAETEERRAALVSELARRGLVGVQPTVSMVGRAPRAVELGQTSATSLGHSREDASPHSSPKQAVEYGTGGDRDSLLHIAVAQGHLVVSSIERQGPTAVALAIGCAGLVETASWKSMMRASLDSV